MARKCALYGFHGQPKGRPLARIKSKQAKSLLERGLVKQITKWIYQYSSQMSDCGAVEDNFHSSISRRIDRCAIVGEHRAVSGGLMSPGIATVGPRNIAKIPHEMSRHFQGR